MTYIKSSDARNLVAHEVPYSSISSQKISTTQVDVSGTEVQYDVVETIPFAQFVVYEYNIQMLWDLSDHSASANFELWEQTNVNDPATWSFKSDKYRICETFAYWHNSVLAGKFLIPIYSGSRKYKIRVRSSTTSNEFRLHLATTGSGTENKIRPPIIKMYTI